MQCVLPFSLQTLPETFFSFLRRTERDIIKNIYWSPCKVPVILVIFLKVLNFLDIFSKNTQILKFIKICPMEAELFHAGRGTERWTDGRTDGQTRRS